MNRAVGSCTAPDEGIADSSESLSRPIDFADTGIPRIAYFVASNLFLCFKIWA